jgi:hypothetical protein
LGIFRLKKRKNNNEVKPAIRDVIMTICLSNLILIEYGIPIKDKKTKGRI